MAEYERRQRHGVTADELDLRWLDTLVAWKDRPDTLQDEPEAARLRFYWRRNRWLIFMRGYPVRDDTPPSRQVRLPDYLAVDPTAGEVRRFVDVRQADLFDYLDGLEPLTDQRQDEVASRWGNAEPRPARPEPYRDDHHRVILAALIRDARMPVYGIPGNPHGLDLASHGHSGGDQYSAADQISLIFGKQSPAGPRVGWMLSVSSPRYRRHLVHRTIPDEWVKALNVHPALWTFRSLASSSKGQLLDLPEGLPERRELDVMVRGDRFRAALQRWAGPSQFMTFTLTRGDEEIDGASIGLSTDQVLETIASMVVLQDEPALVAQYQEEFNRRSAALSAASYEARRVDPGLLSFPHLIRPGSVASGGFMYIEAPGTDQAPSQLSSVRPRSLEIVSRTDQPATYVQPFDGTLTLRVPPGFSLKMIETSGVEWSLVDGQPHVVRCVMVGEAPRVVFTTEALTHQPGAS